MYKKPMTRYLHAAAMIVLISLAGCSRETPVEFEVPLAEGTFVSKQHLGEVIYLDFWATWCGPCLESFPWMSELQDKYAEDGLKVVAVSLDTDHALALQFADENGSNLTIGFDDAGELANSFDVVGMPTSVVIGRDGTIEKVHQGFTVAKQDEYESSIVKALKQ